MSRADPKPPCVNHPERTSRVNLDGEDLCQECADLWCLSQQEPDFCSFDYERMSFKDDRDE